MVTRITYMASHAPNTVNESDIQRMLTEIFEDGKVPRWLEIIGVALDASKNLNGWRVLKKDFPLVVASLQGKQYRKNHGNNIEDILGKVTNSWIENDKVFYKARIVDADVIKKILLGLVNFDSIQLQSDKTYCDKCYKENNGDEEKAAYANITIPHNCGSSDFIVGTPFSVVEISAVADPAYPNASFSPTSFVASVIDPNTGQDIYIRHGDGKKVYDETLLPSDRSSANRKEQFSDRYKLTESHKAKAGETLIDTSTIGEGLSGKNLSYESILSALEKLASKLDSADSDTKMKLEQVSRHMKKMEEKLEEVEEKMEAEEDEAPKYDEEEEAKKREEELSHKREARKRALEEMRKRIEDRHAKMVTEASIKNGQGKAIQYADKDRPTTEETNKLFQSNSQMTQVPDWLGDILKASKRAEKGFQG